MVEKDHPNSVFKQLQYSTVYCSTLFVQIISIFLMQLIEEMQINNFLRDKIGP